MKKIFIGGFAGVGTVVVMEILKKAGYFLGEPFVNGHYDFLGHRGGMTWVSDFDRFFFDGKSNPIIDNFNKSIEGRDSWALKHGHMMWIAKELREWYKDSCFIYVMRNPVDTAMGEFFDPSRVRHLNCCHRKYGGLSVHASVLSKAQWCIEESLKVISVSDYVVRLEDLCSDPENEICRILDFAGVDDYDFFDYDGIVSCPDSIGRGRSYYESIDMSCLGY